MEGSASSPATSGGGPVGAANSGKPGATGEEVLDKKRLQVCLLKSRLLHSHWVIQADRKSGNQGRPNGPFNFLEKIQRVRFLQMNNQGLHQLFLTVSWDLRV